jgi:CheY-like chemotaxis protein
MQRLFDRFERGEDTYSKNQEGTGIGLNLTRHLVELNGGRISVESKEGQGSVFWIMMPIAADEGDTVTQKEQRTITARLDGLTTLVVDDNNDTCEVLKQILSAAGATVLTEHSTKGGISALENCQPDIVLTDLAMPGESGVVLIEHIRKAEGSTATIPIIVLSACAFEADRVAAMDAGASVFIPKPFKPSEIIQNVRQLTINLALKGS